jgi:RHS repeat-associated protein
LSGAQTNYVSNVLYAPPGGLAAYQYGNNLARQIAYNNRLQTSGYSDTDNNTAVQLIGTTLSWGTKNNNGNLQSAAYVNVGTGTPSSLSFSQTYGYDLLNRLTSAGDSGWSRTFSYDAFGNMWVTANSGVPLAGNTPTTDVFNANNQIAGSSYDTAGNQTLVNGDTLAYDAENRQISSTFAGASETYLYDGNGQRVEKSGPSGATIFVYDAMGKLAAEYSTAASASPCTTCYLSADHLGSTRLVTDSEANVIARHDYLPFGEEIAAGMGGRNAQWGAGNDTVNQKFTGKERDSESGLDWFEARYFGSALGRFTSPDPENSNAMASDPQSWNMYAYARNNPLAYSDPTGLSYQICDANGKNCTDKKNELTDEEFAKEKKAGKGNGETFKNGTFYHTDENGNKVVDGTYRQTDVDLEPMGAGVIQFLGARADASNKMLALFAGGSALAGGGAVIGGVFAGGELTTLAITGTTASEESTALAGTLQISQHAAERMAERGFTRDMIRATIKNGTRYWDPKNGTFNYILRGGFASGKNALVGVNPVTNVITTVIDTSRIASRLIPF